MGWKKTHLDKYLYWFYETIVLLEKLLKPTGSIFVHLDWHVGHYAKIILDEIFGRANFKNEIIWHFYNKLQGNINRFPTNHQVIFWYTKTSDNYFKSQYEKRPKTVKMLKRVWDKERKMLVNARDDEGKIIYIESDKKMVDDVWRLSMLQPADKKENLGYATQKPETILKRIIKACSKEGDLILDCFAGSGTTAAVAEKLGRRWIACDLSRFAIHMTRKRLLGIEQVKPFVIQNLGKYERQVWQTSEFGDETATRIRSYISFIINLYGAQPLNGYLWLHGIMDKRLIHVGSVDSPVSSLDVGQIVAEFKRSIGTGKEAPLTNGVDVLGWAFAFELNELAKQQAAKANVDLRFLRIPREVLDKRAIEQGDIRFFELAALDVEVKVTVKKATVEIKDFVIPADDVPADVQKEIKHWSQWIDYWAVDWNNKNDTFHNEWQEYRTREKPELATKTSKTYDTKGEYRVVVKVIDILGNDTTKVLKVKIQ